MIIFITVSSLALIFLIYKICKGNKISLDTKLNEYDTQRGNISEDIIFYQNKIISLEEEKNTLDDKIIVLLTKKIINFHKEHQRFNDNAIKKIKYLISTYANGNEYIENKIYENIDIYIDIDQIKKCDISNYNSDNQNLEEEDLNSQSSNNEESNNESNEDESNEDESNEELNEQSNESKEDESNDKENKFNVELID